MWYLPPWSSLSIDEDTHLKEEEEECNWYKKLIQKKETYGADKRIGRQKRKAILEREAQGRMIM